MRGPISFALLSSALAACGGSTPEPRTGAVTIVVRGPDADGAQVVFHRPNGAIQEVHVADAAGMATATVAEGSLVTVGRRVTRSSVQWWDLVTIAGVDPGDLLTVGSWGPVGELFAAATLPGPVDGASRYLVDASCSAAFADAGYVETLSLSLTGCTSSIDALALARNADGTFAAYAAALDVFVGGTTSVDPARVTLGPWQTQFGTLALELTNAPPGSRSVTALLDPRRDGRLFWRAETGAWSAIAQGGSTSVSLAYPQAFATSGRLEVDVSFGPSWDDPDAGTGWIIDGDAALASRSFDLSAAIPPRLSGAKLTTSGGALVASWQQAGVDAGLDGVILGTAWISANGVYVDHVWRIVAPPGTTSFTFPPLPVELAAFAPGSGAWPTYFSVTAYDGSETHGYAAFRSTRLGLLDAPFPIREIPDSVLRGSSTASYGNSIQARFVSAAVSQAAAHGFESRFPLQYSSQNP
jgi:hypothetical protein